MFKSRITWISKKSFIFQPTKIIFYQTSIIILTSRNNSLNLNLDKYGKDHNKKNINGIKS